jgi:hypothetical protein
MATLCDVHGKQLGEWRSRLLAVLAEARDRAEDVTVAAETVCRRTSDARGIHRMLANAVRVRDAVDEALTELEHWPGGSAGVTGEPSAREKSATIVRAA